MWENTVAILSISKENNYKAKFLTSSILKIYNFREKKQKK
jgi:hypothetical protein